MGLKFTEFYNNYIIPPYMGAISFFLWEYTRSCTVTIDWGEYCSLPYFSFTRQNKTKEMISTTTSMAN